ncbi:hypothetical protein ACLQ3C_03850 [Gordonia sp. DT30]|uniref:hypothetical protein n=1 Tax=unclassified Gordonia (in: high G+C Gram-positive bacteria) TaxID=2657482 RepID=UPI003CEB58A7
MRITESDGSIRLVPMSALHESERAILENKQLYEQTRRALNEVVEGKTTSSDWLFDE